MAMTAIRTRVLEGFDDPSFGPERWEHVLRAADQDLVYLSWHWQRAWWETFGNGQLLLIAAERDGEIVALAPLYARSGMVYFVGAAYWEADRLDFVGEVGDPEVLAALLDAARDRVPGFLGFEFEFIPDGSRTGERLQTAADQLGLSCYEEYELVIPTLDLTGQPEVVLAATHKKKLLKHERFLQREGLLEVRHLRDGAEILPQLEAFFEQHIARWAVTPHPSFFLDQAHRLFYERLTRAAANTGWLRFTRIDWDGRPIAFHYGFCYHGRYVWNVPSFAIDLARHSPGQILLRQLLLAAIGEGARIFDFGTQDQAFKLRFASHVSRLHTWSLYPTSRPRSASLPAGPVDWPPSSETEW